MPQILGSSAPQFRREQAQSGLSTALGTHPKLNYLFCERLDPLFVERLGFAPFRRAAELKGVFAFDFTMACYDFL